MTPRRQRIAILVLVIGFVVLPPLAIGSPSLRASYVAAANASLVLASIWLWGHQLYLLWRRFGAGAVLCDLGRAALDGAGVLAEIAPAVAFALWGAVAYAPTQPVLALGPVSVGLYLALQALLPFVAPKQLRAGGLALPGQFIPWSWVGSFTVREGLVDTEIALRYRTWTMFSGFPWEVTLHCPHERQKEVLTILATKIPPRGRARRPWVR